MNEPLHKGLDDLGRPIDQLAESIEDQAVVDLLASTLGGDQSAIPKTGEMGADSRLRLADGTDQIPHRPLAAIEEAKQLQTGGIGEDAEESSRSRGICRSVKESGHIRPTGYHRKVAAGVPAATPGLASGQFVTSSADRPTAQRQKSIRVQAAGR